MNNNQKATKRALLTSVMALVMCVVMLVGTTFAWFTDTASTAVNKIQAGNLDVELLMYKKITDESYDYVNISKEKEPIFGSGTSAVAQNNNLDTLWEPGKTQVAYLAIKNEGNLALKYKVALNVTNPVDGKDLYKVMQYAIVPDAKLDSAPVQGWTTGSNVTVGQQPVSGEVSLAVGATHYFALLVHMDEMAGNEYKNGKVDFDLTVYATQDTVENDSFGNTYDQGATYPVSTADLLATYGNNGLNMPAGVVITTERDPEGTNGSLTTVTLKDYEAFVYFTQVFDHAKAYEARKELLTNDPSKLYPNEHPNNIWYTGYIYKLTVKMDCDIDLENASVNPFLFADIGNSAFTFDGNGHTIKNANLASSTGNVAFFGKGVSVKNVTLDNIHVTATGNPEGQSAGIVSSNANADIDNVTVKNSSVIGGKWTGGIVGYNYGSITNCTVENCTVSGQYKVGGIVGYICGSNDPVKVTGNKLTNVTIEAENILAGKTAIIGKIVSNWNAPAGTCKDNTFSGTVPDGTNDIGKIESGCIVTQ